MTIPIQSQTQILLMIMAEAMPLRAHIVTKPRTHNDVPVR
jgi:hypothetical protein